MAPVAERRARRQRTERRGPSDPARGIAAIVALACAAGLAALALADVQPIAAVEVTGARHVARDGAVHVSRLSATPVFRASAAEARASLLAHSALRDARVEVVLPDRARIALVERDAVGRWVVGALEWFVDAEGVLFESVDPSAAPALRVRDERAATRAAGERLDPALVAAAIRLAKVAPGELRPDAARPAVRIEPGPSGIVLDSGAGWQVRFGGPERIEDKLALALRFLREQPGRRLEYVDVRSADRIVFSPE